MPESFFLVQLLLHLPVPLLEWETDFELRPSCRRHQGLGDSRSALERMEPCEVDGDLNSAPDGRARPPHGSALGLPESTCSMLLPLSLPVHRDVGSEHGTLTAGSDQLGF